MKKPQIDQIAEDIIKVFQISYNPSIKSLIYHENNQRKTYKYIESKLKQFVVKYWDEHNLNPALSDWDKVRIAIKGKLNIPKRGNKKDYKEISIYSSGLSQASIKEIEALTCSNCFKKATKKIIIGMIFRKDYAKSSNFNFGSLICEECYSKLKKKLEIAKNIDLEWATEIRLD